MGLTRINIGGHRTDPSAHILFDLRIWAALGIKTNRSAMVYALGMPELVLDVSQPEGSFIKVRNLRVSRSGKSSVTTRENS